MQSWHTRSRNTILDCGKYLVVENHVVELPDGRVFDNWPWVITPAFINVVVVTEQGQFVCFRQTKYAVEGTSLAPVGGYLDAGEEALTAAKRELMEETGYEAPDWVELGNFAVDGNRGSGVAHLYLARNARCVAEVNADDLEEQEMLLLSRSEVEAALAAGEFKLLPWAAVFALALQQLKD
jgi:ADP-ribose pyrophosphatase